MTTLTVELSKEDKSKIRNCDYYLHTKTIMQSHEDYQYHEVGTVIQIKHKQETRGRAEYIGDNNRPYKFLIIEKDGGFLFAKRIISTGKPGELVTCLTIEYPSDRFEIEVEPDMADAMLLDAEYDPLKTEKNYQAKKNKASRLNKKKQINFNTPQEAYDFVKGMKVGETYYTSVYSYGGEITTYEVKEVKVVPLSNAEKADRWLDYPGFYTQNNISDRILVTLKMTSTECRWGADLQIEFFNFIDKNIGETKYSWKYRALYKEKPIKPTDIQ